ncbi:MAG: type 4b pilus protein PilO2 [Alphaproteobacteria bacterium]|nr:type 4b pilus protein PilO2 [Alphaproteobacteria bacterium]
MIKQVITVRHRKFATGLFWQPMGVGNTARNWAKELTKTSDIKYDFFTEYRSMIGLASARDGAYSGMASAAAQVVDSLSEFISFLAVFSVDKYFYLVAVRNGIIIRDILVENEDEARKLFTELSSIPDWGVLIAPSSWGIPKSQEKNISDLIENTNVAKLRQIGLTKSVLPAVLGGVLFVLFGIYVLTNPVKKSPNQGAKLNTELAKEYRKQIELKKQEALNKRLAQDAAVQSFEYPYDNLPNVIERANLCYKAIAFVMQPIPGWNQTFAKCDGEYVSATFRRDFGTLNDFYEIGGELMPGAIVQQTSEDEVVVRVKLPALETHTSLDERDSTTVARDVASIFQQINMRADINNVTDTVLNNGVAETVNVTEVAASSKLMPAEFMYAFKDFQGVYMTSVSWRANTRLWNYEVIIYTK